MDSKANGMAWVSKLCKKTEAFFAEMDEVISEEPLKYVENQLLTAGENVKQFCSSFIQDVFYLVEEVPSSPLELNEKLAAETMSLGLDGEHQNGSCNSNSSVEGLPVVPVEQLPNDSPCKKQCDIGTNMGTEDNAEADASFVSQISEVIASVNENVICGVRQPNTEGSDDQLQNSSFNTALTSESSEKHDVSSLLATIHSNISSQPQKCRYQDVGLTCHDNALSTVSDNSNDSLQPDFEPCNTSNGFPNFPFSDVSESINVEPDRVNHYTKQSMSTTMPTGKLKLDDSCILIDCNEISSASETKHLYHQKHLSRAFSSILKLAKEQKHKKATLPENLNEESDEPSGRYHAPPSATAAVGSMYQDIYEAEWELV